MINFPKLLKLCTNLKNKLIKPIFALKIVGEITKNYAKIAIGIW